MSEMIQKTERRAKGYPKAPRVKVVVTQPLIESAMVANSGHCMTADAIRVAFPGAVNIAVDIQTIRFSDRERRLRYVYLTPRIAQIAIVDWDDGVEIKPFEFTLVGGSVTEMGSHVVNRNNLDSAATVKDPEAHLEKAKIRRARSALKLPKQRTLDLSAGKNERSMPPVVGGEEPPVSRFSLRREYGLRGFSRPGAMNLPNLAETKIMRSQKIS